MPSKIAPSQHYPGKIEGAIDVTPKDPLWSPSAPATQKVLPSHFKKVTNADGIEVIAIIYCVDPPIVQDSDDYVQVALIIDGKEIDSTKITKANRNKQFLFYISQNLLEINTEYEISYELHRDLGETEQPTMALRLVYDSV
ncbi:hypothetical protein [Pseudomonas sp. Marseille-Q5117]|uniref:hypothetical protein n=1 Tax=Pseudomonas sp. Marseille-Q5117 TaxID=2972777 RepID=UPI0021C9FE3C|nr:hypothetical protein [Pseudomonas sp. Marseille-Q5117]